MKIPATLESVKKFLENSGLDFCKYDKLNVAKEESLILCDSTKVPPHKT